MLIDYCPMVVRNIKEIREICSAEQPEINNMHREVDRLLANRFISMADEHGIERFEKELGIVPGDRQSVEDRRIAVMIKSVKKNMSFRDIVTMLDNYQGETELVPDYEKEELNVITRGNTESIEKIYEVLDEIIALNILICFMIRESGHVKAGIAWQDDEILELKEAAT